MSLTEVTTIAGPIVALIGAYLAYSHSRQIKMHAAEKRLAAYKAVRDRMGTARSVRVIKWKAEPLTQRERKKPFDDFVAWYEENGSGIFLGGGTRSLYLWVEDNLVCDFAYYAPSSIREKLRQLPSKEEPEKACDYLSTRLLSRCVIAWRSTWTRDVSS